MGVVYFNQRLGASAGQNLYLQHFSAKKLKKCKKLTILVQNLAKNGFFSLHQNAG